jgi:hypothetical protein
MSAVEMMRRIILSSWMVPRVATCLSRHLDSAGAFRFRGSRA